MSKESPKIPSMKLAKDPKREPPKVTIAMEVPVNLEGKIFKIIETDGANHTSQKSA